MKFRAPQLILIGVILLFIVTAFTGPRPIDWSPNFSLQKKTPFGSYLLFQRLTDIFPGDRLQVIEDAPMDFLESFGGTSTNYLLIQDEFEPDQFEADKLLEYVGKGNNLFIASNSIGDYLEDTLNLSLGKSLFGTPDTSISLHFAAWIDEEEKEYPLMPNIDYAKISEYDGKGISYNDNGRAVFVKRPFGKGNIFLHSIPFVFTNYYMVDSLMPAYVSGVLSQLPAGVTFWDEYYKPNRMRIRTPLVFILERAALKWAWLLSLVGIVLFVIFRGKRKQRIIPVITPPVNSSLEFAETVGRLYLSHGNHKDIASKKIKFFFDHIRTRFQIATRDTGAEFEKKLSQKTGIGEDEISRLMHKIRNVRGMKEINEILLLDLCKSIDQFYKKSK